MYTPSHFDETRFDTLRTLVTDHPLGTLVLQGPAGLDADHIPFELSAPTADAPFGILRAHVARANPLWRLAGQQALVVFQGPSAYISPSLYEEKQASGKVVPTYNYAVVHAHGALRAIEDPAWLLAFLDQLTQRHESTRTAPWSVHDAPRDYIDKLLGAIVGIEIRVERMQGKWKASQNRPLQDRINIAAGEGGMAALVRSQLEA